MTESEYFKHLSFLIVDDNAFMRTIIKRILRTFGAEDIQEAHDGAQALSILNSWKPDIIFADWEMQPFDGMEFTRKIRQSESPELTFVPIIMVSSYSEFWRIAEARDAGVTEFLVKPISARTLVGRVIKVIEHPRAFVKAPDFFGPDRRRHNEPTENERRHEIPLDQDDINAFFAEDDGARE
ncbi:MAG: response regulator [Alphaproteobacteria bacterium]|nr:response regulator [Alphaproteobacteria bacterium]MBF0250169.1 response regulator [Alphaproteobacteria bacterium]